MSAESTYHLSQKVSFFHFGYRPLLVRPKVLSPAMIII